MKIAGSVPGPALEQMSSRRRPYFERSTSSQEVR
jgi:hypothetical protein